MTTSGGETPRRLWIEARGLTVKLAILFFNKADSCLDLTVIRHVELDDVNRSFDAGVTQLLDCFMTRFLDTP